MKRSFLIIAPPLVFALAAAMAWLTGPPAYSTGGEAIPHGPRKRAAATIESGDVSATLRQMESRILPHNPAPPAKDFDAQGMDDAVFSSEEYFGSGMQAIEYSSDWAKEAPQDMFGWLVRQNGKRSFYAYMLFGDWAGSDMEAALDAVFRIPDSKIRAQALISSVEVLCKNDPGRARELLTENLSLFPPGGDPPIFQRYDSGKAHIHLISSLPIGEERTHLLARLMNSMDSSKDAVAYWKGISESERRDLVAAGFAPYTTHTESFDGLDDIMRVKAEATGDPDLVERFIECHGKAWAKHDLAAALDWAQVHLKGKKRVDQREEFFQVGIREDFDETLRIWQTLPEGDLKGKAARAIVRAAPEPLKAEAAFK